MDSLLQEFIIIGITSLKQLDWALKEYITTTDVGRELSDKGEKL